MNLGGAGPWVLLDLDELHARLRALERRAHGRAAPEIRHGDLVLDPAAQTVTRAGVPVPLSRRKFAVLKLLLERRGRALSRRDIEAQLYGSEEDVESNAVEVHVHHLRRKLGADRIRTIRGVGYVVEDGA